jgi:hypothetical protein
MDTALQPIKPTSCSYGEKPVLAMQLSCKRARLSCSFGEHAQLEVLEELHIAFSACRWPWLLI